MDSPADPTSESMAQVPRDSLSVVYLQLSQGIASTTLACEHALRGRGCLDYELKSEGVAHCGLYHLWTNGPLPFKRTKDPEPGSEPVSSVPPWYLLQFMLLGSCLRFLPWPFLNYGL